MMDDHRDAMYAEQGLDPYGHPVVERKPKRKLLEKDIQKQCVTWARERGWWARKFSSPANRSVPDYLFAKQFSHTTHVIRPRLAIEFKAPGKTSTDAQVKEQEHMRAAGWTVLEYDNVEWFKEMFQAIEDRPDLV